MKVTNEFGARSVPRLKPGQGFKGPEPVGCFNTGTAPCIFRSKIDGVGYLVGPEICIQDARDAFCFFNMKGKRTWRPRDSKLKWKVVYRFRSRGGAVKKFVELVNARMEERRKDRREISELKKRAANLDMDAVLKLGDYGVSSLL